MIYYSHTNDEQDTEGRTMADPQQLALLQNGATTWNRRRQEYPGMHPDLSGANLVGANLAPFDLAGANLTGANLSGALLTNATLSGTDLTGAIGVTLPEAQATVRPDAP